MKCMAACGIRPPEVTVRCSRIFQRMEGFQSTPLYEKRIYSSMFTPYVPSYNALQLSALDLSTKRPSVVGQGMGPMDPKPRPKGRPTKSGSPGRAIAQCQICAKQFNNSSALAKHKLTHSDERKYVCVICSKAFKRQDHLNGHMMTHRSKKPYECKFEGCEKSYCDARSLRRHLENHHNNTDTIVTSTVSATTLIPPISPTGQFFKFEHGAGDSVGELQQPHGLKLRPGSPGYLGQISPISPAPSQILARQQQQAGVWHSNQEALNSLLFLNQQTSFSRNEPKPVECTICHRRFKNVPALNGHMRLHGGYFKKKEDGDNANKCSSSETDTTQYPPDLEKQEENTNNGFRLADKPDSDRRSDNLPPPALKPVVSASEAAHFLGSSSHLSAGQIMDMDSSRTVSHAVAPPGDIFTSDTVSTSIRPIFFPPPPPGDAFSGTGRGVPEFNVMAAHLSDNSPAISQVMNTLQDSRFKSNPIAAALLSGNSDPLFALGKYENNNVVDKSKLNLEPRIPIPNLIARPNTETQHIKAEFGHQMRDACRLDPKMLPMEVIPNAFQFSKEDTIKTKAFFSKASESPAITNMKLPCSPGEHFRKRHASADEHIVRKRSLTSPGSLNSMLQDIDPYALSKSLGTVGLDPVKVELDDFQFVRPRARSRTENPVSRLEEHMYHHYPQHCTPTNTKRKHRPEPLIIPPQVNHFGFASRLRSPRLWDATENHHRGHRGHTPPPYTPPPMLSPVRSGSGLFCKLKPNTPKTAPATPRLLPMRRVTIEVRDKIDEEGRLDEPPPETDILPHVNVGHQYQAMLPDFNSNIGDASEAALKEDLVWSPAVAVGITEEEIENYQEFACCAAIPKNGVNREYALHVLNRMKGDIKKSILELMSKNPMLPKNHHLNTYHYQESDRWSTEDIEAYHSALLKCDKDFYSIAKKEKSTDCDSA